MRPFERGFRAAKSGLKKEDCRMNGNEKEEWLHGFDSYVHVEPEDICSDEDFLISNNLDCV